MSVTCTERGWPGHFFLGDRCVWRRNTLLTRDPWRIVVSSVGRCRDLTGDNAAIGGNGRVMETMCFVAKWEAPYWEALVSKHLPAGDQAWFSTDYSRGATVEYERIHELNVAHWQQQLEQMSKAGWDKLIGDDDA